MKKKILYLIVTFVIFSVIQAFSYESDISVWLSDLSIFYKGEKIEFVDANGNSCDSFIYNGVTYVPLRSVAEKMGKEVYWNSEDKTVTIEDKSVVKGITLNKDGYTVTAEMYSGEEENIKMVSDSSVSLESFDNKVAEYEIEIDYFEPIPVIEAEVEEEYKAEVNEIKSEEPAYSIEIFNNRDMKIADYTVKFKRKSFGEYLDVSDEVSEIKSITAVWADSTRVKCFHAEDDSWSVRAYKNGYDVKYQSPETSLEKTMLKLKFLEQMYSVYYRVGEEDTKLFTVLAGGYAPSYDLAEFDLEKTEHTVFIDYFEPLPKISSVTAYPYIAILSEDVSFENPTAKVKIYKDVQGSDSVSFVAEHTITFKRCGLQESLALRGIDSSHLKEADEIYTRWYGSYDAVPNIYCVRDENDKWTAHIKTTYIEYTIDAPDM